MSFGGMADTQERLRILFNAGNALQFLAEVGAGFNSSHDWHGGQTGSGGVEPDLLQLLAGLDVIDGRVSGGRKDSDGGGAGDLLFGFGRFLDMYRSDAHHNGGD